jgi:hypothetical protein
MEVRLQQDEFAAKAACGDAGEDRDLFFGPEPEGLTQGQHQSRVKSDALVAKVRYCDECPVRAECLEEGLFDEFGVWGGYGPDERDRLVKGIPLRYVSNPPETSPRRTDIVTRIKSGDSIERVAEDLEIKPETVAMNLNAHLSVRMRQRNPIVDMQAVA